jgi:hypothetical protein
MRKVVVDLEETIYRTPGGSIFVAQLEQGIDLTNGSSLSCTGGPLPSETRLLLFH